MTKLATLPEATEAELAARASADPFAQEESKGAAGGAQPSGGDDLDFLSDQTSASMPAPGVPAQAASFPAFKPAPAAPVDPFAGGGGGFSKPPSMQPPPVKTAAADPFASMAAAPKLNS